MHAYDPKTEQEWRSAYSLFARETLELAAALNKNATQFSQSQCQPPPDIMDEALRAEAAQQKREPVARSLGALMDAAQSNEGEEEGDD